MTTKSKKVYHVVDQDTGETLSKHTRSNGPSGARVWLKAYKKNGFKVAIHYRPGSNDQHAA